jgi:hypothetical protein
MKMLPDNEAWESREICQRAAIVRRAWSNIERIRRLGLPPDTPRKLLNYFGERFTTGHAAPERAVAMVVRPVPSQDHGRYCRR